MKLLKGEFTNFGSYAKLEFDFSSLGLALAFGKTGSGKSTLPDLAAWTLYGETAKGGNVDDVRSWQNPKDPTIGVLEVKTNDGSIITVTRKRGTSSNDLYWVQASTELSAGQPIRGKDLTDTQKLLEARLGVSSETYFMASYFHEFSTTGSFFTARAKDRRATFERIADLSTASTLLNRSSDHRKNASNDRRDIQSNVHRMQSAKEQLFMLCDSLLESKQLFFDTQKEKIQEYETKSKAFEKTKQEKIQAAQLRVDRWDSDYKLKIKTFEDTLESIAVKVVDPEVIQHQIENAKKLGSCVTCGQPLKEYQDKIDKLRDKLNANENLLQKYEHTEQSLNTFKEQQNPHLSLLKAAQEEQNNFEGRVSEEKKKKTNPFNDQIAKLEADKKTAEEELGRTESELATIDARISNLTTLYDLSFVMRGELLKQAVQQIQDSTNRYLEKYFDSEIKVGFALEGTDELSVSIQKSGYDCAYKQLSRGQRALLKMTFVVSMMKAAANKSGVHFSNLFLDEVLDGMDADLKIKAFSMLEELSLEHESILVIDHDQGFQNLFTKRFHVTMDSDISSIEELQ